MNLKRKPLPKFVWAYWNNRRLHFTTDRKMAEANADGFTWDSPRVRKVGLVFPLTPREQAHITLAENRSEYS